MPGIGVSLDSGSLQKRKSQIRINPKEVSQHLLNLRFDEIFPHRVAPVWRL